MLFRSAEARKLRFVTYVNLRRVVDEANQRSPWHWASVGIETVGQAATIVVAADALKIKEAKYRALIPTATAGLMLARGLLEREYQPVELPADLMQPRFTVPANGSVDFSIFVTEGS